MKPLQILARAFNRPADPEEPTMTTDQAEAVDNRPDPPAVADADHAEHVDDRDPCPWCRGTGKVFRTADWLQEALTLFPADDAAAMDAFVAEFYKRLVQRDQTGGPDGGPKPVGQQLAPLFPADLTTGDALNSKGNRQRDMLLSALVDLMKKFDPDHLESGGMKFLVERLRKWGRDHASFQRPDGTVRGATPDEYLEVRNVLVGLLRDAFGVRWLVQYEEALAEAYHFAMTEMQHSAQHHRTAAGDRPTFGRQPRRAK